MTTTWLDRLAMRERRRAPLWAPVFVGLGIWLYFAASTEPSGWLAAGALALPVVLAAPITLGRNPVMRLALAAIALTSLGFASATIRARLVAAPVLEGVVHATVEGRVAELSRSAIDRPRAMLEDVVIYGLPQSRTPARVRITLLEGAFARDVEVGERISVFARLGPPGAPYEPGGFDYRRFAWFQGLGATGQAIGPAVKAAPRPVAGLLARMATGVASLRGRIARGIEAALPGAAGGFASAILVGSRGEISRVALQNLRDSNLAHLLAISGLHMGLLSAIVFALVRLSLAAIPRVALRVPTKKAAALVALAAAAAYLVLSGASVATQRAFIMAAVALVAIMLDRPAISLRALSLAALAILLFRPESLMSAGFRMSFAAATALVAVYEVARARQWFSRTGPRAWWRAALLYAGGVALTSAVAGLATAPFAADSFNRMSQYGLVANVAAVPIMALLVMPMGALAAILAPLGLYGPPLRLMGLGIDAILWIAERTSSAPGAVRAVVEAPFGSIWLITLGGLWLCLWSTRMRLAGLAGIAAGLTVWATMSGRPEALVAPDARAIGVMGPEGRAIGRATGGSAVVRAWLRADGDLATREEAAKRPGIERDGASVRASLSNGWTVVLLRGRARASVLSKLCATRTTLIAPRGIDAVEGDCVYLGPLELKRLGALSLTPAGDEARLTSALALANGRFWSGAAPGRGEE